MALADGTGRLVIACSCEGTLALDGERIARGCGGDLSLAHHLPGRDLGLLRAAAREGRTVTAACACDAGGLAQAWAEAGGAPDHLAIANLRETAAWSDEAADAGPKMAALIAGAAVVPPPVPFVALRSEGVALVYGRDEAAVEAGRRLAAHLDITVLLDRPDPAMPPPRAAEFPVLKGTLTRATGHLGRFELTVDGFAHPLPSSRAALRFGEARDGATSRCDLVLDLTGRRPLFPAHELRPGYLRADPQDPAAVERALLEASHLSGTFDKPRYADVRAELCAHSRNGITGCTRCLELCPTGAITPAGDHVAIDAAVCAGCGACASACPTGAAAYALPPVDNLVARLRAMLLTYAAAGGRDALVLFHDGDHGEPLIEALARFGPGLPARVLPVRVNEATQLGPEAFAAALAYGAAGVRVLTRARPRHDTLGLERAVALAETAAAGLGYGSVAVAVLAADDPDLLRGTLDAMGPGRATERPSRLMPAGRKREVLQLAFSELHRAAPAPAAPVPLASGAPFGGLDYRVEACTLCLACTSACPTAALTANEERPELRFDEALCVQCGLCAATCPEDAIAGLIPRLDVPTWTKGRVVLKEEEPFPCEACGKPFGTRSSIERVAAKLAGSHWMFTGAAGEARLKSLRLCEDCRVTAAVRDGFDPHGAPQRPRVRTAEDYAGTPEGA